MRVLTVVGLAAALSVSNALAQFPVPTPRQVPVDSTRADTVKVPAFRVDPPISPLSAFGRSLLIPGWGQSILGRRVTGALFVFWEGVSIGMTLKAVHQLAYLEKIGADERAVGKRQEIQDWAVLIVFNHLMAGAEAFVSAQLWDFPIELETRGLPDGSLGLGARVALGSR
ncbi:MAG TPA: hypothetical protein VGA37_14935 [Gemmatimonadales bacterium]